jgi:hypothetical protein
VQAGGPAIASGKTDPPSADPFLVEGGEAGALIRAKNWSDTPLGPIDSWSQSLRMMVSFLLANRFPLLLWWGPHYISIYNDDPRSRYETSARDGPAGQRGLVGNLASPEAANRHAL